MTFTPQENWVQYELNSFNSFTWNSFLPPWKRVKWNLRSVRNIPDIHSEIPSCMNVCTICSLFCSLSEPLRGIFHNWHFISLCFGRFPSPSCASVKSIAELFFVFMSHPDNGNVWNVAKQNTPPSKRELKIVLSLDQNKLRLNEERRIQCQRWAGSFVWLRCGINTLLSERPAVADGTDSSAVCVRWSDTESEVKNQQFRWTQLDRLDPKTYKCLC